MFRLSISLIAGLLCAGAALARSARARKQSELFAGRQRLVVPGQGGRATTICAPASGPGPGVVRSGPSLCAHDGGRHTGRQPTYRVRIHQSHPAPWTLPAMKKANDEVLAGKVFRSWRANGAGPRRSRLRHLQARRAGFSAPDAQEVVMICRATSRCATSI